MSEDKQNQGVAGRHDLKGAAKIAHYRALLTAVEAEIERWRRDGERGPLRLMRAQYAAIHDDFRAAVGAPKSALVMTTAGTSSVPVEIVGRARSCGCADPVPHREQPVAGRLVFCTKCGNAIDQADPAAGQRRDVLARWDAGVRAYRAAQAPQATYGEQQRAIVAQMNAQHALRALCGPRWSPMDIVGPAGVAEGF